MIQIKHILVPIDFSEYSRLAAVYARELAERFGARVHLLHVVHEPLIMGPDPDAGGAMVNMEDVRQSTELSLTEWANDHMGHDTKIERGVRVGAAYVEIVRYAREHDIDLIVLGSHGRTGLMHVLLGSVAEREIRKAPCPVMTVRPEGQQFVMP